MSWCWTFIVMALCRAEPGWQTSWQDPFAPWNGGDHHSFHSRRSWSPDLSRRYQVGWSWTGWTSMSFVSGCFHLVGATGWRWGGKRSILAHVGSESRASNVILKPQRIECQRIITKAPLERHVCGSSCKEATDAICPNSFPCYLKIILMRLFAFILNWCDKKREALLLLLGLYAGLIRDNFDAQRRWSCCNSPAGLVRRVSLPQAAWIDLDAVLCCDGCGCAWAGQLVTCWIASLEKSKLLRFPEICAWGSCSLRKCSTLSRPFRLISHVWWQALAECRDKRWVRFSIFRASTPQDTHPKYPQHPSTKCDYIVLIREGFGAPQPQTQLSMFPVLWSGCKHFCVLPEFHFAGVKFASLAMPQPVPKMLDLGGF